MKKIYNSLHSAYICAICKISGYEYDPLNNAIYCTKLRPLTLINKYPVSCSDRPIVRICFIFFTITARIHIPHHDIYAYTKGVIEKNLRRNRKTLSVANKIPLRLLLTINNTVLNP